MLLSTYYMAGTLSTLVFTFTTSLRGCEAHEGTEDQGCCKRAARSHTTFTTTRFQITASAFCDVQMAFHNYQEAQLILDKELGVRVTLQSPLHMRKMCYFLLGNPSPFLWDLLALTTCPQTHLLSKA